MPVTRTVDEEDLTESGAEEEKPTRKRPAAVSSEEPVPKSKAKAKAKASKAKAAAKSSKQKDNTVENGDNEDSAAKSSTAEAATDNKAAAEMEETDDEPPMKRPSAKTNVFKRPSKKESDAPCYAKPFPYRKLNTWAIKYTNGKQIMSVSCLYTYFPDYSAKTFPLHSAAFSPGGRKEVPFWEEQRNHCRGLCLVLFSLWFFLCSDMFQDICHAHLVQGDPLADVKQMAAAWPGLAPVFQSTAICF